MPKRKRKSVQKPLPIKDKAPLNVHKKNTFYTNRNFLNVIWVFAISIVALLIFWIFIPAIIANTPLIKSPVEKHLSEKFNAKVNVRKIKISNWTLSPKVKISSIDFYEKNTNLFIAYIDYVSLQLAPLSLLAGDIKTEKIKIARVDVELPSLIIQRYLLDHNYISKPVVDESLQNIDQFLSFVNSVITLDRSNGYNIVEVNSECELPFMHGSAVSFVYVTNPKNKDIEIKKFHASGIRSIERLNFEKGNSAIYKLDLPVDIDFTGKIKDHDINISPIKLTLDTCIINASYKKNATGTFLNISATDQNINRIERLFNTRVRNNRLEDVSFQLKSYAYPTSKKMLTDCSVKIKKGIFRNVPFKNYTMSFNLLNDKINSFKSNVDAWNGKLKLNLLNKQGTKGLTNILSGHISATRVDLNACLGELSRMPARAGGEFNFNINFDVDNIGIAQFIHNRLAQLEFTRGSGEICLSNAYLKYFAGEKWQTTRKIPKIVRRFLNLAANMTGAPLSLPLLNKLLKHFDVNKPRTVFAKLYIENGNLSAPEIHAETTVGTLMAIGKCTKSGALNYKLEVNLNQDIIDKYGDRPLLSMFLKDNVLELPVSLTGSLEQPDVQLNLSPEQKILFEEHLTILVTKYVEDNFLSEKEKEELTDENLKFINKTVKSLISRFL